MPPLRLQLTGNYVPSSAAVFAALSRLATMKEGKLMDYKNKENFSTAIQTIFPKLMHYLQTEENRELTGLDITPGQVNALLVMYFNESMTMGELSQQLALAESAVTRMVNRLVKLNLVRRCGDEKDRRIVRVSLTSFGRQLARLVFNRRTLRFNNLAEHISAEEREMLIGSLQAVLRVFEEFEQLYQQKQLDRGEAG